MKGIKSVNAKRISSDNITTLNRGEIFVFGSNKQGLHHGGAALHAYVQFDAKWGVGEGITGHCYALPTMEGTFEFIRAIGRFIRYAKFCSIFMPWRKFLVTKVGCGITGYSVYDVAIWFRDHGAFKLNNVYLPQEFYDVLNLK